MALARIFNLADNEVQQQKSFTVESIEYDFTHLQARKHTFKHPKRNEQYTLYFTFSHHTFTRGIKENEASPEIFIYPYPRDLRIFDNTRYELSKLLPQIVENLPKQFCYHGGYSRYCSCKITQADGTEVFYQAVYRAWKEKAKMRFHIESAYPLPERPGKVKKVDVWIILHNLLRNKKLPVPVDN